MPSTKTISSTCLSAGLLALATACGGNNLGSQVKPDPPSAQEAITGEASDLTCKQGSYAEPLIIDLPADKRVDLEARMKESVVIVNYDCNKMTILKDCSLTGDYNFAGVSMKEQVISLNNQDELSANLPFSSGSVGGSLETGTQLNLALIMVGKRSTAAKVSKPVLSGSQCGEATHFMRAATVGAFAMKTGAKGKVAAAVELFGAGTSGSSSAEESRQNKDGDIGSCKSSKPDAETPPDQCRSAIRLELVPIPAEGPKVAKEGEKKAEGKEAKLLENPCSVEGFTMVDGKCTDASKAEGPKLCDPTSSDQCKAECAKGSSESCHNYAELAFQDFCKDPSKKAQCDGSTTQQTQANERVALEYWKKACDGGKVGPACDQIGQYMLTGIGGMKGDHPMAKKYLTKGCDEGISDSCWVLSDNYLKGEYGTEKDVMKGLNLKQRACDLGEADACMELGKYYFKGQYLAKDPKRGFQFLKQFCDQGSYETCAELGEHLLGVFDADEAKLKGVTPVTEVADADKLGREYLEKACANGNPYGACSRLGHIYVLEKKYDQARKFLPMACKSDGDACLRMAKLELEGLGGPKDKASAMEYYAASVDDAKMFEAAQAFERGAGIPKNTERAVKIYNDLCDGEYVKGCVALKRLDKEKFTSSMFRNCERAIEYHCKQARILDKAKHVAALSKACSDDDEDGCKWLKAADSAKAKEILEARCKTQQADKTDDDKYACKYKKALFGN